MLYHLKKFTKWIMIISIPMVIITIVLITIVANIMGQNQSANIARSTFSSVSINAEQYRSAAMQIAEEFDEEHGTNRVIWTNVMLSIIESETEGMGLDPSNIGYYTDTTIRDPIVSLRRGLERLWQMIDIVAVQNESDRDNLMIAIQGYHLGKDYTYTVRNGKYTTDNAYAFKMANKLYDRDEKYALKVMMIFDSLTQMDGTFAYPVDSPHNVSSPYGSRTHPITGVKGKMHYGIDFPKPQGANIYASESGQVVTSGWHLSYGYQVVIKHNGRYTTRYAHNSKLFVDVGDIVSKGQKIAACGSTGNSTGPHCHFEIILDGHFVDPAPYLKGELEAEL